MVVSAPEVLPIFRSRLQGDLLAELLLHPDREATLSDLAQRLGAAVATVQREADRLVGAGLLAERRIGRARLIRANPDSPLTEALTLLVARAFGPSVVVAEEFNDIDRVQAVQLFGSWAARYTGTPGPAPHDVDVLVIGEPARGDVYDAAERAEQRLGMPVNPLVCPPGRWADATDPFLADVRSKPRLELLPGKKESGT